MKASKDRYNFTELVACNPALAQFIQLNPLGKETIDFSNPKAVKALNTTLLKKNYKVDYWEFPDAHLCPPIPGRMAYIQLLHKLLKKSGITKNITVFDIGTGATCIYPLLGQAEFGWRFIASEIDNKAFKIANKIVENNSLQSSVKLRFQKNPQNILTEVLNPNDRIAAAMCNPPFYKNEADALESNTQKLKGLGQDSHTVKRNFSGTEKELCYPGGEKAFLHNYLYQSSLFKTNCFWYTSLVSKKEHVKSMQASLKKLGATSVKVLDMSLGNKVSRVVAWTFLNEKEQKEFGA
ncbi:23S rRNA (adenine(1618)-N(6))-methyltransferase RlmF [Psychroserpens sp.]|uniref:23S rRNA (adenine(1618)-N(6))-methyltransferase RlmF n=1 Tax=Psychroserpens sp. TaxID=2020870 RepID=UPI003C735538